MGWFKTHIIWVLSGLIVLVIGFAIISGGDDSVPANSASDLRTEVVVPDGRSVATFAAGCFWCTEAAFQELDGVDSVVSGYAGGTSADPTYEQIYTQATDHREAVQIIYDPSVVTFDQLLNILWRNINPTDDGGQFVDRGFSYTTAVFYHDDGQKLASEVSIQALEDSERFDQPIVTKILPFTTFYEAEDYHQDFYIKSSERYEAYESASNRDEYKAAVWGEIQKEAIQ